MNPSISEIERDIWIADGATVPFFGFPYPTRMTVVRLLNLSLWVCSTMALSSALAAAVNALGSVRYLVWPNKLHYLFLKQWARAGPTPSCYASPGLVHCRRNASLLSRDWRQSCLHSKQRTKGPCDAKGVTG